MNFNPFQSGLVYENDIEGLVIPYKLQGKIDLEIMTQKYIRLRKTSYGYIVRLGIPSRG